jgi:SAM-dependent methyltransferase
MTNKPTSKKWQDHEGPVAATDNDFDVIDCQLCGFKHITPIPSVEELEKVYQHDYYKQEKPLYLERYQEDLDWWNMVYTRRYEILEQHMPVKQRRLLDIGSGPGFFLLNGQERGWQVKGIEPSIRAAEHSRGLGLDVENIFFSEQTAPGLGTFDAINMGLVLEHIPDPAALLKLIHHQLNDNGMVCIIVPNDFNPFQTFLLMGDNYIGNDELGRACHTKRMNFEKALNLGGAGNILSDMYTAFASQCVGREIVLHAKKVVNS